MTDSNGKHKGPQSPQGGANMEILSEDDHMVTFKCHCGEQFKWAATSPLKPTCPECDCDYQGPEEARREQQERRDKIRQNVPQTATYKYFAAYVPAPTSEGETPSTDPTYLLCVGANVDLCDFMLWFAGTARSKEADLSVVTIRELTMEQYIDTVLEIQSRRQQRAVSGVIGILGKIFGGNITDIHEITGDDDD